MHVRINTTENSKAAKTYNHPLSPPRSPLPKKKTKKNDTIRITIYLLLFTPENASDRASASCGLTKLSSI